MGLNALTDPWIYVRDTGNIIQKVGIKELLLEAQNYYEIVDDSIMNEFGVFRLIQTLVLDCFRPQRLIDIEELLEEGNFDKDRIERYIEICMEEGTTFDFFDEKRPFLQYPKEKWSTKDFTSVAKLNPVSPSGNNHIHFVHEFENEISFPKDEAARLLCAAYQFSAMGGRGYTATVYDSSKLPTFCVVKGNNLFETLVLNLVPTKKYEKFDAPRAIWRRDVEIEETTPDTSLIYGMIFPCRKIRLIEDGDIVKEMQYGPGTKLVCIENYTDPNISYVRRGKDNVRFSISPSEKKESWRDIGSLLNKFSGTAPATVFQYGEICEESPVRVITYEVPVEKAKYLDCRRGELQLSAVIFNSEIKFEFLNWAISKCEMMEKLLVVAINRLRSKLSSGEKTSFLEGEKYKAESLFYDKARFLVWSFLLEQLTCSENLDEIKNLWQEQLLQLCVETFEEFSKGIDDSAKCLLESEEEIRRMRKEYLRKYKE